MNDLVLAFVIVGSLAFSGVFCLFGAISWFEDWLEERQHRMSSVWLQGRERP